MARNGTFTVLVAMVGLLALAPAAMAGSAYVTNAGDGTVAVFDTTTNAITAVIRVGGEPVDVAIAPNGTRAYVANKSSNSVDVIDTGVNVQPEAIPVGKEPVGIAAAPDGHTVYVANFGDESVSVIDTGTSAVVRVLHIGKEPDGVAVSPDGTRLLVAQRSGSVLAIDTGPGAVMGSLADAAAPSRVAIVPSGSRGLVTNSAATSVNAFNPATANQIGAALNVGAKPAGIAIGPSGQTAYVAGPAAGTVTPIDTSLSAPFGVPVGGFPGATGIAIRPDGLQGYVTNSTGSTVTILDTTSNTAAGSITVGPAPTGIAVVPDQGPRASLFVSPARKRAKKPVTFRATGSVDRDGKVANYVWEFGDGARAEGPQPIRVHRYRQPGEYLVKLTVIDDDGCSTAFVYTGQTASCVGSPQAVTSNLITVGDTTGPVLRLAGGKRQSLRSRVLVRAHCPREPCALSAHGLLVTSIEDEGVLRRRSLRIATAQAPGMSRAWRKLRLRIPGAARRAARRTLLEGGAVTAKLSVVAHDLEGESRLERRKVELHLP